MGEKTMPGYMTYREAALIFSLMPDAEAAQAIKATVNYYLRGEEPGFPARPHKSLRSCGEASTETQRHIKLVSKGAEKAGMRIGAKRLLLPIGEV